MAITIEYRRLFLRGLKWDSEDANRSLYDTLKIAARARLTDTSKGILLTGTASNGSSVSFTLPANGQGATPQDMAEMIESLINQYDASKTSLTTATVTPNDEAIFAHMLESMCAVTRFRDNFRMLGQ